MCLTKRVQSHFFTEKRKNNRRHRPLRCNNKLIKYKACNRYAGQSHILNVHLEKLKAGQLLLKHPNQPLQTYSDFQRGKTLDDPKWTNHIWSGIMVVCDVKVTLRGFCPRSEASGWAGQRAGCINRQIPACSGTDAGAGNIRALTKKAAYVVLFNSGFVVFRLSNGKSSIPCVRA